jgi:hypothetical protein
MVPEAVQLSDHMRCVIGLLADQGHGDGWMRASSQREEGQGTRRRWKASCLDANVERSGRRRGGGARSRPTRAPSVRLNFTHISLLQHHPASLPSPPGTEAIPHPSVSHRSSSKMQMRMSSRSAVARTSVSRPRTCNAVIRRVQVVQQRDVRAAFFKLGNKNGSDEAYQANYVSVYANGRHAAARRAANSSAAGAPRAAQRDAPCARFAILCGATLSSAPPAS